MQVSKLFADSGMVCLASFISPYRKDREKAKEIHESSGLKFFEVYLSTPIEVSNYIIIAVCVGQASEECL